MSNIFQQPWTLFIVAVFLLLGIITFRRILPERRRWWQLLLPLLVAVAAFGLDFLVQTDLERIRAVIKTGSQAVRDKDFDSITAIISDNYRDSYHHTKEDLLTHGRIQLSQSTVAQIKKVGLIIEELLAPQATAVLTVLLRFTEDSRVAQAYKAILLVKIRINFEKQPDKKWLISRIELLEIDRQPVRWRQVR